MRRPPALIGLLLLLAMPFGTAGASLYDEVHGEIIAEQGDLPEQEVMDFIIEVFNTPSLPLTPEMARPAMRGDVVAFCTLASPFLSGAGDGLPLSPKCADLVHKIEAATREEERVRGLGRQLQSIAAAEEVTVSPFPGGIAHLAYSLTAVAQFWTDGPLTPGGSRVRAQTLDPAPLQVYVQTLATDLNALTKERRTAAVWRYQYGLRLVRNDRDPYFPTPEFPGVTDDGEMRYLTLRWDGSAPKNLEKDLNDIYTHLPVASLVFHSPDDIAYFVFPPSLSSLLPENVFLWARIDGQGASGPYSDIGLSWSLPREPVLPSLLRDDGTAILGGSYPAAPGSDDEGMQLCSDPIAESGLLCSPLSGTNCPTPTTGSPGNIRIVHCQDGTGTGETVAGPDVCREIPWRITPQADPSANFNPDKQCAVDPVVDLICDPAATFSEGLTAPKKPDGHIQIHLNPNTTYKGQRKIPETYFLFHELTHAYQGCTKPVGFDYYDSLSGQAKIDGCCHYEGEAYRNQCSQMELDGMFTNAAGAPLTTYGVPLNATVCTEAYTDVSCFNRTGSICPHNKEYPNNRVINPSVFVIQMEAAINASNRNPKGVPDLCADAIDPVKMDFRVKGMLRTVNERIDMSRVGTDVEYSNTLIGNLCYAGSAVEQAFELHHMNGGDMTSGVEGEIAPRELDPAQPTPLIAVAGDENIALPAYRPEQLADALDRTLCQLYGLPPLTPAALCALHTDTVSEQPITEFLPSGVLRGRQGSPARDLPGTVEGLSLAIGLRAGDDLYADTLPMAVKGLAGILKTVADSLKAIGDTTFPTLLCPLGPPEN